MIQEAEWLGVVAIGCRHFPIGFSVDSKIGNLARYCLRFCVSDSSRRSYSVLFCLWDGGLSLFEYHPKYMSVDYGRG